MKNSGLIAFTFGGTGGHIYPCIALAQEIDPKNSFFIGSLDRNDGEIILKYGYSFIGIPSSRKNPFIIIKSFFKARDILKRSNPKLLISAGGYLTFAVVLAAYSLGIPINLFEQNILPGRVNRYLGFLAQKIFISFKGSEKYFPKNKVVLSGNPVRKLFLEDTFYNQVKDLEPNIPDLPKILIFGGSQGALGLNNKIFENYEKLSSQKFITFHITGPCFYQEHFQASDKISIYYDNQKTPKIITLPYSEKMDYFYQKSNLVISRAGATTIAEILHFNKKSILIPYPHAKDNHQYLNAKYLEKEGKSRLIEEKDLNIDILFTQINNYIGKC
ncbi:glycosyltransferase [Candidatus Margulisiibacteriota bacterium]